MARQEQIDWIITTDMEELSARLDDTSAPQIEEKELVRRIVKKIIVDLARRKGTVYFRQIPKIDEALEVKRAKDVLLGALCSANGNLRHPVQFFRLKTLKLE